MNDASQDLSETDAALEADAIVDDVDEAAESVDERDDAEVDAEGDPEAGDAEVDADEADDTGTDEDRGERLTRVERLEREGDIAADYLEELLDIADFDGDLDMDVDGDRAAVSIVGADLAQLVGRDGEVLDALQELTRLAVYRETGERSRLMLDIGEFRAQRRAELVEVAAQAIARAKETGERVSLEPMTAFERKVVHDEVAAADLVSESEGAEPRRFVVILPA